MIGRERQKLAVILLVLSVIFISIGLNKNNESREVSQHQSTGIRWRNNTIVSIDDLKNIPKVHRGIYVREAYRVSDDEVRLIYLQSSKNPMNLKAKTVSSDWRPVEYRCYSNKTCNDMKKLYCSVATRIGSFKVEDISEKITELHVATELSEEYSIIPVNDVRVSDTYEHQLGVCTLPMFFYTDWTLLVHFFESWIAQGATKFYIYLHSYTWQTKRIIDFYKQSLGDNLELIEWSDVPVSERHKGSYDTDPNAQIYRQGGISVMHDCMLRARSHVKYIANMDLDEVPVAKDLNIIKVLDDLMEQSPKTGQLYIDWIMSEIPVNWDGVNKLSDVKINLNDLKVLDDANVAEAYRAGKKIIHRPERVRILDMHVAYENEVSPKDKAPYTGMTAFGNPDIYLLHPRRFIRNLIHPFNLQYNTNFDLTNLKKLNIKMNQAFSKRLEETNYTDVSLSPWVIEARRTFRDLEICRREAYGISVNSSNPMCIENSGACGGELSSGTRFEKTTQTWIDIAHVGNFHSYTKKT